jgi:hypothetical protein
MEEETRTRPARQQSDAASFTRGHTNEEIKQPEKEIAPMNRLALSLLLLVLPFRKGCKTG